MGVRVAGLVLVRQRPGTASGICFVTIEEETGIANLVVFKKLFNRYRKEVSQSRMLMVEGKLQIQGEVIHVIAQKCWDVSNFLLDLTLPQDQLDEAKASDSPTQTGKAQQRPKAVQLQMFPTSWDFK